MGCFTPFKTSTCRPFEDSSEEAWCSPNFFYVMKEVLEVITIAALHILKIYVTVVLSGVSYHHTRVFRTLRGPGQPFVLLLCRESTVIQI